MTIISYHSTLFSDVATLPGAVDTTSSHIFLSRGVAGASPEPAPCSRPASPVLVASIFESADTHIMTVGDAAASSVIGSLDGEASLSQVVGDSETKILVSNNALSTCSDAFTDNEAYGPKKASTSGHKRAFVTSADDEDISNLSRKQTRYAEDNVKGKSVDRGRTLNRERRHANPLARAESRSRRESSTVEIEGGSIEKRGISRSNTFFEDPNDPRAILEDSLLEPCPQIPLSNTVEEVLSGESSPTALHGGRMKSKTWNAADRKSSWRDSGRPVRALTTVFNDCQLQSPSPLPTVSRKNTARRATYASQLEEMTVSSKSASPISTDYHSLGASSGFPSSLAQILPTEIVQEIFKNLSPADFNSARHSCRSWFINSLNETLLETMLRRAGFATCLMNDSPNSSKSRPDQETNKLWQMSKRISRECALGPDWLGNGMPRLESNAKKPSAFLNESSVDFRDVAVHYPGPDSAGTVFTISTCGKFLMVANGCLVYIYELNRHDQATDGAFPRRPGHLLPVTSIICPRRVLACSMDTSSHRYAIAILLDGRMGLVCDITTITRRDSSPANTPAGSSNMRTIPGSKTSGQGFSESARMKGTSFLDRVSLNSSSSPAHSDRVAPGLPFVFPGIATTGASSVPPGQSDWQDVFQDDMPGSSRTAGPSSRHASIPRAFVVGHDGNLKEFSSAPEKLEPAVTGLRVEDGLRSLYRNLCSDDDPPRSVAICPQRRCVAFGCSSGIELHWVDALTGQDLNRWFPLTAPSDFLFFLPPRKSVDSAKKLRLISSASRPNERPAISERSHGSQTWGSPLWERFGWGANHHVEGNDVSSAQGILTRLRIDTSRTSLTGRMDCSDHYRAIPISDGYHILFTDPATGLLCLGSDAPVGGPTKLLRKIWFKGPEGEGSPVVYAGGSDLSWGVRVVAGFGTGSEQSIWLFSVPLDVFTANQSSQPGSSTPAWFSPSSSREARNMAWIKWWPDDGLQEWLNHTQDPVPGILPRSVWPVKIRGQKIGTCSGLVDLVVDSGPQMTVWAFSKGGIATVWRLDDGKHEDVKKIWVQRDGTVREVDGEGDVEMADALSSSLTAIERSAFQQQSFDGTSSAVITTRCERRHRIKWNQSTIRYDADGDVLMDDAPYSDASAAIEEHSEEVDYDETIDAVYQRGWWTTSFDRLHMRDIVEELAGIARIDVEIH